MRDAGEKRRLILLTNQYPYMVGDYPFVSSEIAALADQFDEVVIFNYTASTAHPMAQIPPKVSYGGNLFGASAHEKISRILRPWNLARSAALLRDEFKSGQLAGNYRRFFLTSLVGMTLANDPRLRRLIKGGEAGTTIYSFWGLGAALAIPWLPKGLAGIFVRVHGYDLYKEISGYLPFRRTLFRRVKNILAISDAGRKYLMDNYPGDRLENKVVVRRLGTSNPNPGNADQLRRESGTGRTGAVERLIVSCSNVNALKRVHRIAAALALMESPYPLRWVHFGAGPLEDDLRRIAQEVEREGLAVELKGAVGNDEVLNFYGNHEISAFVNVSTSEGVPVSIMEAISFNIPVVATSVGGTPEIVGGELKSGELIPADFTDEQLAQKITDVLGAAPGHYEPRATWQRLYDADVNAARTASLLAGGELPLAAH